MKKGEVERIFDEISMMVAYIGGYFTSIIAGYFSSWQSYAFLSLS